MIKIDKGVPLPPLSSSNKRYPWREMAVGDSIHLPDRTSGRRAQMSAYQAGRRHGMEFTIRVEGDGVRIWRVK